MRITTLDYAILGLLLSGPKTAYAIRMIFKTTAMGNFSSSPGSIYPASHKLRKLKLVNQEKEEGGVLTITDKGRTEIKDWLTQPVTEEMIKKESHILILKFAFMDHMVTQEEKETFLESFLQLSKTYLKSLEAYWANEGKALPLHGGLSFQFGISSLRAKITWLKSTLQTIKNNT